MDKFSDFFTDMLNFDIEFKWLYDNDIITMLMLVKINRLNNVICT